MHEFLSLCSQFPPEQTSIVQASPSSVQAVPSGLSGLIHVPHEEQTSFVHSLPSLEHPKPVLGVNTHPLEVEHELSVHSSPSSQVIGECVHTLFVQLSLVHALPSPQAVEPQFSVPPQPSLIVPQFLP
jgi:hypothetical protein